VLGHLGAGCDDGLCTDGGTKVGSELLILLLQGGSIVAIVSVLERDGLNPQSLYKESEPHGPASEALEFYQGDTCHRRRGYIGEEGSLYME
jgi:hypothetical protein